MQQELAAEMEQAAEALEFERAAAVRDRIRGADPRAGQRRGQPGQPGGCRRHRGLADRRPDLRAGVLRPRRPQQRQPRLLPDPRQGRGGAEVLAAFIAQFYDDKPPPPLLLLNHALPEQALIAEALTLKAGRKVEHRGAAARRKARRGAARRNQRARGAGAQAGRDAGQAKLLEGVAELFGLPATPERIEVYDNSHIMGTNPYGVMVVAGPEGFMKTAYRKFGIRGPIAPGDDFAMMREVLQRRFGRALRNRPRARRPSTGPTWC